MEISILPKNSLRIKGKNSFLFVDPSDKSESNAALFLSKEGNVSSIGADIIINGPGEYETGGIKITGIKQDVNLVYNITVDYVSVLLGKISSLEKINTKLKEANILVVNCDNIVDASFLTVLATNVIIFYGEKSAEVCKAFGQENATRLPKYTTTIDKLPAEVEIIILE